MSLDQFKDANMGSQSPEPEPQQSQEQETTWDSNWHIDLDGYWDSVDERFFGEGTPNEPPIMQVPEKLAAEMHILDDPELVEDAAEMMYPGHTDDYVKVIRIVFNDLSTWHVPLKPWDNDPTRTRQSIIKKYLPQIVKWEAILEGEDPEKAAQDWDKPWEFSDPEWYDDVSDTDISEDTRKWLNQSADWVQYIDRKVESNSEDVDLDVGDEDWQDDW